MDGRSYITETRDGFCTVPVRVRPHVQPEVKASVELLGEYIIEEAKEEEGRKFRQAPLLMPGLAVLRTSRCARHWRILWIGSCVVDATSVRPTDRPATKRKEERSRTYLQWIKKIVACGQNPVWLAGH